MIECEKRIVSYLVSKNLLNQDSYLIKDGSIQYKPMKTGNFKDFSSYPQQLSSCYWCFEKV